jgi:hypothetical protein
MTRAWTYPHVELIETGDREMSCPECSFPAFSSRAPELVGIGRTCPRCGAALTLVPPHATVDVKP